MNGDYYARGEEGLKLGLSMEFCSRNPKQGRVDGLSCGYLSIDLLFTHSTNVVTHFASRLDRGGDPRSSAVRGGYIKKILGE